MGFVCGDYFTKDSPSNSPLGSSWEGEQLAPGSSSGLAASVACPPKFHFPVGEG